MCIFVDIFTQVKYSLFGLFECPVPKLVISFNTIVKLKSGTFGQIKSCIPEPAQHSCRINVIGKVLKRFLYNLCFCFTGSKNNSHSFRIIGNCAKADCYYKPVPRDFNTSQITRRCGLRFKICGSKTGSGIMIAAPGIESNMSIRAYSSEEKPYSSQLPYLILISSAPVINSENRCLLDLFPWRYCFPVSQGKINPVVRENL